MNNNNDNIETRINELIDKSLEESITSEEFAELNEIIASDKKYASYYLVCMQYRHSLYKAQSIIGPSAEISADQILAKLAEYETVAPAVRIKREISKTAAEPLIETPREKIVHNVSKPFVTISLLAVAAMILLLVFIQINPNISHEVVTVVDSINAKYADPELSLPAGSRISTKFGLISLKQGFVKLLYDDTSVEVIIEAPAEFEFKSAKELCLYSGKTFAAVPPAGKGFAVRTPHSRIIDLGTQFGVTTDSAGDTEVHVFKGRTMLVSGTQKTTLNLAAGFAKRISNNGDAVKDIQVASNAFIREIRSETGFIWRGENAIPLTNLLAGTFFDASPDGVEINPANGQFVRHEDYVSGAERFGLADYQKIESPFVDGTFIPLGEKPQVISSTDLSYQFPRTSGSLHYNLSDRKIAYDGYTSSNYPLDLAPSLQNKPLIFLHPNMGITIDLDKIRQELPAFKLGHFRAACGIAPAAAEALKKAYPDGNIPEEENPGMDFLVLLDGKTAWQLTGIGLHSGIQNINVEIQSTSRFLTLAATDGNQCFKYDWFVLADPVLEIAAAE